MTLNAKQIREQHNRAEIRECLEATYPTQLHAAEIADQTSLCESAVRRLVDKMVQNDVIDQWTDGRHYKYSAVDDPEPATDDTVAEPCTDGGETKSVLERVRADIEAQREAEEVDNA